MPSFIAQLPKFLLFFSALWLSACSAEVKETPPPSSFSKTELDALNIYVIPGDYYEMKIGLKGNELTGVYRNPAATNKEDCFFFFEGTIGTSNPVKVKCYNPSNTAPHFNGSFKILADAMIVRLNQLPSDACQSEFVDQIGYPVILDARENWSAIRIVEQKTALYDDVEGGLTIGKALDKGTVVAVLEKRGTWLWVDVQNKDKEQGWIPEHVLYPLLEF